ncbi:hypothetical protein SISNIDRAFT_487096 [Sistotremastrum niveocremeum HHB9708]|uniref:F-box domain-containing protein n=1 Tax=Sistotremastrum niveocremeum HHB9708 TaxID=1314777 RepID=A0A164ST34_9AGAM|nr:hypothetical protein SISNIDRAFT_487096 [Sistotremastrum niveocremeum HHB9708]
MSGSLTTGAEIAHLCTTFKKQVAEEISSIRQQAPVLRAHDSRLVNIEQILYGMDQFLKEQRNLCTPIGRLTDEIILEILHYCMGTRTAHEEEQRLALPSATFLCKRWRELAIRARSLWSHLVLPSSPALFRLFRDRSGALPVSLYLTNRGLPEVHEMDFIGDPFCQLASRISHLDIRWATIDGENPPLSQFLTDHIRQKAFTYLKTLDMRDEHRGRTQSFSLNTPALQILRFSGIRFRIPQVQSENLVELQYRCPGLGPRGILELLSGFPRLERCSIEDYKPLPRQGGSDLPQVSLTQLQSISIKSLYVAQMRDIVSHLQTPSSATIDLGTYEDHLFEMEPEDFIGSLLFSFDELRILERQHIYFALTSEGGRSLKLEHEMEIEHKEGQYDCIWLSAIIAHPSSVSRIALDVPKLPSLRELVKVMQSWNLITHISIRTEAAYLERLFTALEETPNTPCPLLKSLDCRGARFSGPRMTRFLEFRRDRGVALQELKFTKGFSEPPLGDISSLVGHVMVADPPHPDQDGSVQYHS